jgi:hypothetical protein
VRQELHQVAIRGAINFGPALDALLHGKPGRIAVLAVERRPLHPFVKQQAQQSNSTRVPDGRKNRVAGRKCICCMKSFDRIQTRQETMGFFERLKAEASDEWRSGKRPGSRLIFGKWDGGWGKPVER